MVCNLCGLDHGSHQVGLHIITNCLDFGGIGQSLHYRHSNSYVGAWGPEDLLVPHPVKGIVKVAWLDPYASGLLFCLGFNLSAIKPVNIACFAC